MLLIITGKLFGLVKVAASLNTISCDDAVLELTLAVTRGDIDAEGPIIPGSDHLDVVSGPRRSGPLTVQARVLVKIWQIANAALCSTHFFTAASPSR